MKDIQYLEDLLKLDKVLINYSMCMEMVTKYKENKYNYSYHALIRQKAADELEHLKKEFENHER